MDRAWCLWRISVTVKIPTRTRGFGRDVRRQRVFGPFGSPRVTFLCLLSYYSDRCLDDSLKSRSVFLGRSVKAGYGYCA